MCAGSRLGSKPATVSRWCTFGSVPFNWRCGASLLECARVAMMCRGLTSSGGSQEAGGTFSASTGLWPTAGLCTTIRAVHHDYWRKVREGENANEGKATTELCRWSRPCLASCGKGCSEDCAHVRHAATCGKTARLWRRSRETLSSAAASDAIVHSLCWYFCGYQYSGN